MNSLIDTFNRRHDYLRISLTDRCNFRCTYCMPEENMRFLPTEKLMQPEEISKIVSVFVGLGVNKIRITGGEPTMRKDFEDILSRLAEFNVNLSMTTNGFVLEKHFDTLIKYGVKNLNISMDSLDRFRFGKITQRDQFDKVIQNIEAATGKDFKIRINVVVIRAFNDDELIDFIKWSSVRNLEVRFIEFMPFFGNQWSYEKVFAQREILKEIRKRYVVQTIDPEKGATATRYTIPELNSVFGIIPTVSNPFCSGCNRIRLTADGKLRNCLFSTHETDLLANLRGGKDVEELILKNISEKKKMAAGRVDFSDEQAKTAYAINRPMIAIGG